VASSPVSQANRKSLAEAIVAVAAARAGSTRVIRPNIGSR
jgi:hypothetical protein